jgi:hypothetical protein
VRRQATGSKAAVPHQSVAGTVTRDGKPVGVAWVSLWARRREHDSVNAWVQRGRVVTGGGYAMDAALVGPDGRYTLNVPYQGEWFVRVDEPGGRFTVAGPLTIALNEQRRLDVAACAGGTVTGTVRDVPPNLAGYLRVVAFDNGIAKAEARVGKDGAFRFDNLPPGEYGLKAGFDGALDPDVPQGREIPKEAFEKQAEPWKRAVKVAVADGQAAAGVTLAPPALGPPERP